MVELRGGAFMLGILGLALTVAVIVAISPLTRAAGERVTARARIEEDRWAIEREEHRRRQEGLTQAVIVASSVTLFALAGTAVITVVLLLVFAARHVVGRRVVQTLPPMRPVLIDRRVYDPRSAAIVALDVDYEPSLDQARALAAARPRREAPAICVQLVPSNGSARRIAQAQIEAPREDAP